MTVDDALRAAVGLLRRRADTVLPYYALLAATGDVARLPLILGLVVVYVLLSSTGQLEPLIDELAALNPELLSPESPTGLPPALGDLLATTLLSPTVTGPLVIAALLAVGCYVLARGVTRAAAFSAVEAALDDREPLAAGVDGVDRWRTFAGLVVVRWGLLVVAGLPLVAAVVGGVETLGSTPESAAALDRATVVAVLAALVGVVVTAGAVLVVLALLAFAGPVVVVDDVGVRGAVRRSATVPLNHPGGFVLYAAVVVTVSVALGVVAGVLGVAGVGRVAALASTFLVTPFVDGVAVSLYAGWVADASDENGNGSDRSDGNRDGSDASDGSETGERDGTVDRRTGFDESGFVFGVAPEATESSPERPATERSTGDARETETGPDEAGEGWNDPGKPGEGERATDPDANGTGAGFGSRVVEHTPGVRGALRGGLVELGGFLRRDWGLGTVFGSERRTTPRPCSGRSRSARSSRSRSTTGSWRRTPASPDCSPDSPQRGRCCSTACSSGRSRASSTRSRSSRSSDPTASSNCPPSRSPAASASGSDTSRGARGADAGPDQRSRTRSAERGESSSGSSSCSSSPGSWRRLSPRRWRRRCSVEYTLSSPGQRNSLRASDMKV